MTNEQTTNQHPAGSSAIQTEVRTYLHQEFHRDGAAEDITEDMDLLNSGIIDSLGLLKLIAWLENHFGIVVGDADLDPENFSSIQAIEGYVQSRRSTTGEAK